jgi:hypothetical protein
MLINRKDHLQGKNNKRLYTSDATNKEDTAAWQNEETEYKVDQVNKPPLDSVMDAKDWVDNGSKL